MLKNSTRDKLENLLIPPGYEEASGLSRGLRAGVGAAQLPLKGFSKVAQFVTHTSDVAPRLSEFFGKLKERGYTMERLQAGDRPPMNILSEAINAAREVSIDFSRAGTIGRVMNQIIPFYNPALQGMDKMARSFAENPQRMLLRAGVLASVAAANWWLQKDDDWRKVAPGWLKYGFATFTDGNGKPILRLPHTHEYGWSIYAGTEAALDAMYEKNPGVLADWWENAKHRVIPKLAPSYATTPFEVAANYDLFRGRPIVPDYLRQGREPRDQTTGHATGLARWVGDKLNISPDMIDKALQGETGGMYGDVAGQLGAVRDMASGRMPNLADVPIAGGVGLRRDYVRDEQEFYERQHELKQQHGSALLRDPNAGPDPESARIDQYAKLVAGIRAAMKQANPTDRDEQFQYERYMAGAYRAALGREDLARYPNPLKVTDAPPEVQKVIDGWLGKVVERATVGRPQRRPDETWGQFNARREKWQASVQDAQNILKDAGIDKARQRALLIQAQRTKGKSRGLRPSYVPSLQSSGPAD